MCTTYIYIYICAEVQGSQPLPPQEQGPPCGLDITCLAISYCEAMENMRNLAATVARRMNEWCKGCFVMNALCTNISTACASWHKHHMEKTPIVAHSPHAGNTTNKQSEHPSVTHTRQTCFYLILIAAPPQYLHTGW